MSDKQNWDEYDESSLGDNVTEDEIKDADRGGQKLPGKYLCTIEETWPDTVNPKDGDSYTVCVIKMKIDEVIEIEGAPATEEHKTAFEEKYIHDRVSMPRKDEPQALKNRRILIAKRGGFISDSSSKIPGTVWKKDLIGKTFLITMIEDSYEDKKTKKIKTNVKVAFDGYEDPETAITVSEDELDDI